MAKYRKLGRTSSQRKALLRSQVTALINNGKIVTTEARAKEVRKIAEHLITLAVKEKDNFEEVTVTAKVPKKDAEGKRVKEVVDGKKVTVYESVEKTIKKDKPSRLHARHLMLKELYTVTEVPTEAAGRKKNTKEVDLVAKLFDEIAPKLGRTSSQRKALLRSQVTALINNGKIVTTEARAKEVRKIAEHLITLAVKEKDNFEEVTVTAKVPKKDAEGKRVKEVVDGKKVTVYESVEKTIKKDKPSRLHARHLMLKELYTVTEVPTEAAGRKKNTKEVDLVAKLFDEIAPKYVDRKGGYTRIIKIGPRKGDAAMEVVLELV